MRKGEGEREGSKEIEETERERQEREIEMGNGEREREREREEKREGNEELARKRMSLERERERERERHTQRERAETWRNLDHAAQIEVSAGGGPRLHGRTATRRDRQVGSGPTPILGKGTIPLDTSSGSSLHKNCSNFVVFD